MTKVISVTVLHYGLDFLEYALRSVVDHVSEAWVLYTYVGSHGSRTDIPCPESRDDLYAAARRGAGDKLRWHEGEWENEGQQRDAINALVPEADVILVLDSDEIWPIDLAPSIIDCYERFYPTDAMSRFRVPIIHFWRSFYKAVLHDPAFPHRAIFPKWSDRPEGAFHNAPICHMGYAQDSEIVRYKWSGIHGHQNELRKDCDWFNDKYLANAQEDCHPVGSEFWWPEQVNPLDYMPEWMRDHPFFNMEVIP